MWLMVAIVAVLVAYLGGRSQRGSAPAPEPKRFGLEQAEAAMAYVGSAGPAAVKAVLGVVVGVLGFENAVATDAATVASDLAEGRRWSETKVDANLAEISVLEAKIAGLRSGIASNDARAEAVRKIADAFKS